MAGAVGLDEVDAVGPGDLPDRVAHRRPGVVGGEHGAGGGGQHLHLAVPFLRVVGGTAQPGLQDQPLVPVQRQRQPEGIAIALVYGVTAVAVRHGIATARSAGSQRDQSSNGSASS